MKSIAFGVLVVALLVCVGFGQTQFGIGLKLFSGVPFALAQVRFGSVGAELSLGLSTTHVSAPEGSLFLTALVYLVDGKFFPLPLAEFADIYAGLGAGGVTVTLSATTGAGSASISATILGVHLTAGAEARFESIAVFGGGDWLMFFVPSDWVGGTSFPLGGTTYHIGVRYDF